MTRTVSLRPAAAAIAICVLFAAALLPSLGRLDFFDGVEHFNLATVQEMRRDEAAGTPASWMLPTLQGEARVVKPPLTAWLTAALVRPADVIALSTPDAEAREQAFSRFVFLARLPTLACSCLMLLGVFVLGRALAGGDWRVGAVSALACAGTVIFFQQGRRATTDLQLAVWVTWANACIAVGLFRGRPVVGWLGGGLAVGLASMAKGPHIALLMTVVPAAAFAVWQRLAGRVAMRAPTDSAPDIDRGGAPGLSPDRPTYRSTVILAIAGIAIAAAVGLWWYGYVLATVPGIRETWWREATRRGAQVGRNVMQPDPWYTYVGLLALLLPWTGWATLGGAWSMRRTSQSPQIDPKVPVAGLPPTRIALLWLVLPIVVMSFFAEKKERYLLPFVAPAAVLAGWAAVRWWDHFRRGGPNRSASRYCGIAAVAFTGIAAGWMGLSVIVGGAFGSKGFVTADGKPWFTVEQAVFLGVGTVGLLTLAAVRFRGNGVVPLLAVTVVAWLGGEMRLRGLDASPGDRDDRPQRELADTIWRHWPEAEIYSADPVTLYGQLNRPAVVLSMHLNRTIQTRPATLPATPQGRPWVLVTDSTDPTPPVPPAWTRAATIPLRKGVRYVDVLEGRGRG